MTPRPKKNLLEAFQASTREPAQAPAPLPMKAKSATQAQTPGAPRVKSPVLDDMPAPPERRRIEPVLAAGAGALLLVVAFFLGRFSVGSLSDGSLSDGNVVLASNGDEPSDQPTTDSRSLDLEGNTSSNTSTDVPESLPEPPPNEAEQNTTADHAFFAPANLVTVCAKRYGTDEEARWTEDYYALFDLGFPVVQPVPDRNGKWIVLCVGAEPSTNANIYEILAQLQAMPAFSSAYLENIDNVTKR